MPGFNMDMTEWSRNLWERCKKVFSLHDARITALEQGGGGGGSVTVVDGDPTLDWSTRSTVGTINSTALHVTMPTKPSYTAQDVGALPSNTTYVSGVKGDAESTYRSGQVNLTPANIGAQPEIKVAESEWVNFQGKSAGDAGYQAFALDTSLSGKTILGLRFNTGNLTNSKGLQLSVTGATNSSTVNVNYYCPAAITATCNVKLYVYYC